MKKKYKRPDDAADLDRQAETIVLEDTAQSPGDLEDLTPEAMRCMIRELRAREQSYRSQFADNAAVMLLIDYAEGAIIDANNAALSFYGYSRDRLLTMRITDINMLSARETQRNWKSVSPDHGKRFEFQHRLADGSIRYVEVLSSQVLLGNRRALHSIIIDITESKQAEEALRKVSRYARNLIETSLDPLVTISAQGIITDVNAATEKITGMSRDCLIGTDFADYFTEPERARAGYQKVFDQGQVTDYPLAVRHVSGLITDVVYNASVYRDEHGAVLGVFAAARDITERKKAEEALRQALDDIKTLRGIVPICMICKKIRDDQGYWNQVEVYVHDHTEAEFSHGLCPECAQELYPESEEEDNAIETNVP